MAATAFGQETHRTFGVAAAPAAVSARHLVARQIRNRAPARNMIMGKWTTTNCPALAHILVR
jgi:hypothetical protein